MPLFDKSYGVTKPTNSENMGQSEMNHGGCPIFVGLNCV